LTLLAVALLVFVGVAAYSLHRKGLLTREVLDLYVQPEPEPRETVRPTIDPLEAAVSIRNEKLKLEEEAERLRVTTSRMQAERKDLEAERTALDKRLRELRPAAEPGSAAVPVKADEQMTAVAKMYEGMPPEEAAAVLENMPDEEVARILVSLRQRQAGQILGSMSADKAAAVTRLLMPSGNAVVN
jgi:flagellar motility protein MotE (MotC chaperone)